MSAEELGARLLDEVQEESLSEVCAPNDHRMLPPSRNVDNFIAKRIYSRFEDDQANVEQSC